MPRVCTICSHPDRAAIDAALVAGESFRGISRRFAVSEDALARHRRNHLPAKLAKAQQAQQVAQADDLLAEMQRLQRITMGVLARAVNANSLNVAVGAIREARNNLALLGELAGELQSAPVVNVLVLPEWLAIQDAMAAALLPYPQARQAVVAALLRLESGDGKS